MKIFQEAKKPEKARCFLSMDDAYDHAKEIYGSVESSFDEKCLVNLEILIKPPSQFIGFIAKYDRVKFKTAKGEEIYWPIQRHTQEISMQKGLELINQFIKDQTQPG